MLCGQSTVIETCKLCIVKSKLKTEVRITLSIGNFGSDCAMKSVND